MFSILRNADAYSILRSCGRVVLAIIAGCCILPAQLTVSTIRGSATDPSGAPVVGAKIVLVNIATNIERSANTNEHGEYEIPDLKVGTYRLSASVPAFKTFIADNIILETNQIRRIDIAFELGSVSSQITVEAGASVIATDTAKLQTTFSAQRFEEGPWVGDGRNPQMVLTTLPLVQNSGSIYSIQVAGQSTTQVQVAVDGATIDGTGGTSLDAPLIEETVSVPYNNSAEFARVGYISYTTRGGTNQFHGRGAYWHQNSALAARDFFASKKPKTLFHTVFGEFSGPIRKDRTFFNVDCMTQSWPGSTYYLRTVPTDKMRGGDFSQLLSQSKPVAITDPLTKLPFPGNVIPTSRINGTAVMAQNKYVPTSNLGNPDALANNYGFLFAHPTDTYLIVDPGARIDHKLSDKNTIYGRYLYNKALYYLAGSYPDLAWTRVLGQHHLGIEDTHVFSPALVNTFRFSLYDNKTLDGEELQGFLPLRGDQVVQQLGLQGVNPQGLSAMGFPTMAITGYSSLNVQPGGQAETRYWNFTDALTVAKGKHVLKVGVEYRPQSNYSNTIKHGNYGSFNFNGTFTGYGYADFLLGVPYSSVRLNPLINRRVLGRELGTYVQDSFKVSRRLTLELGLRWDRFGSATYKDNLIYNWDPASGTVVVPEEARRSVSPLYPIDTIRVVTGATRSRPSNRNFAPRFGVAYRPVGDKLVIRGGYGIFSENLGAFARAQSTGPYELTETFYNSFSSGQPLFAFPNAFPPGIGTIPSQSVSGYPIDTKNGRIHQFNVTLERELANIGFRLSYQGSRSRGLNYSREINKPQPSLIPFAQNRRPYPQFVGATYARSDGAANFNALTLQVQRKAGQVTFDTHWTLASNRNNMGNLENPYAPLFWNRDPSTSRQRVVSSVIWDLPVGRGRQLLGGLSPAANYVLGGWQLYWVAYMETGQFFSPSFSGRDTSNTNTSGGLPDRISNGNLPSGERKLNHWFDTFAFAAPPQGRFGNSGINILEGPGLHLHNVTIAKRFRVFERLTFTFMAVAQNVLNHANFNNPSANISVPGSLGVISSTRAFAPARQVMLRGRIDF